MTPHSKNIADPNPHKIKKSIHNRVKWLYLIFALFGSMIVLQILATQWGPNGRALRNLSESDSYTTRTIGASSGNIYDCNGNVLSTDFSTYNIRLDFKADGLTDDVYDENIDALCDSLKSIFGDTTQYNKNYFDNLRAGTNRYKLFKRNLNQVEYEKLSLLPIFNGGLSTGFIAVPNRSRYKLYGSLAAYTITHSIEKAYRSVLERSDGVNKFILLNHSGSQQIPIADDINREAKNGKDIITTIDINLQDVVEDALRRQIIENQATRGTVMVVECSTGEIKSISNLTRYSDEVTKDDNNYASRWHGAPGSTFKVVSLMAILDDAGESLYRIVDCHDKRGPVRIKGFPIEDTHIVGKVNLKDMTAQSSNIGFVREIDRIYSEDPDRFIDFVNNIGLNEVSNIQEIYGNSFRLVGTNTKSRVGGWSGSTLIKNSYGYEMNMTPLHTLMLFNAIANNGKLIKPIIVKHIKESHEIIETFYTEVINEAICTPQTLKDVKESLREVVLTGTARRLKDTPYAIEGKTGTAQILLAKEERTNPRNHYENEFGGHNYLATFVGYFPAENPKYTCIVSIQTSTERGKFKRYTGTGLSIPVFKEIADYLYTSDPLWQEIVTKPIGYTENVAIKGGKNEDVFELSEKLKVATQKRKTEDEWVVAQIDSMLHTSALEITEGIVPSVMGMGLKDALYLLERCGLEVAFEGKGEVVRQSIKAGNEYNIGDKIEIRLSTRR